MKPFDSIICVTQTTWEGDFQKAVVQLTSELAERHRFLFVNYPFTVKDLVMGLLGRQRVPVRALLGLAPSLTRKKTASGHEVFVWTPPLLLPLNWLSDKNHDRLLSLNVNRIVHGLRRLQKQLGFNKPLVINAFNPILGVPMLNRLNEFATIYYCFDEIAVERWTGRHGSRYESMYLPKVDAVVTTSETLRQQKSVWQPNTFCVKNGVNFELFHQARSLKASTTTEKPVVGYLGTSDDRINIDLVEYCVRTMPDVTFQFIGEITRPWIIPRLSAYPNVVIMPPRQPSELPALLAQMTVAMIPYARNEHTYTIYPLKINEYLAAGLPVVSTTFSILDDFDGVIDLADTPETFAQALRQALTKTNPAEVNRRVDMARANSWKHRAEEFEVVIEALTELKAAPVTVS